MTENHVIRNDEKHLPSKKQVGNKKIKEQIIYSELKIDTSDSKQAKIRRNRSSKEEESSVPLSWYLFVVVLGSFCFLLLLTTGILGFMVFQGHQADQSQQPPLDNITQEDKYPSEDKTFTEKPFNTGKEISTCKSKWSCCGENCYHFSHELMTFEESKKFCKAMNSKLLKIEDKEELNFIQSQISYFFWIGLFRKEISALWTWDDNSAPSLDVFTSSVWKASKPGDCGIITAKMIAPSDCLKRRPCICEKKIASLAT